uniref:Uncharacterized protein n=1 Tax=viral metagenome TaxID=1070528 RepID=A0A6C0EQQ3_9ZZZZ
MYAESYYKTTVQPSAPAKKEGEVETVQPSAPAKKEGEVETVQPSAPVETSLFDPPPKFDPPPEYKQTEAEKLARKIIQKNYDEYKSRLMRETKGFTVALGKTTLLSQTVDMFRNDGFTISYWKRKYKQSNFTYCIIISVFPITKDIVSEYDSSHIWYETDEKWVEKESRKEPQKETKKERCTVM